MAAASFSGRLAKRMWLIPARTATSADVRTPELIAGGVLWARSKLLVFFRLPRPSLVRSQFSPSMRFPGWQLAQLCQCSKHRVASWKSISPRRRTVSRGLAPNAMVVTRFPVFALRSTTLTVSLKCPAT